MEEFRFAIMGAGNIANKFCDAVKWIPEATVAAVASKSAQRAHTFAAKNGIGRAYGDYEEMLREEKPDCVYIAVLPSDHFRLCMLCMEYDTPVLCEKAMFTGSREAKTLFGEAERRSVFAMEALWSFFMPPLRQVKSWMEEGRIGKVTYVDFSIGFQAERNPANRFFNRQLAGGAAYDITVYAYEIREAMDRIRAGKLQSQVASWGLTTECAELFDRIEETREASSTIMLPST